MTNRVLIGKRGSELGLWCSKPGFDVLTASPDQLLLDMTYRSEQIIQLGVVSVGSVVGLGLSIAPIVILYATANNFGAGGGSGVTRANMGNLARILMATVSASSFSVSETAGSGSSPSHMYHVLRRAL